MLWTKYKTAFITLVAVSLIGGVAQAEVTVEENITYGKGGDTELKLDIARPDGDGRDTRRNRRDLPSGQPHHVCQQ